MVAEKLEHDPNVQQAIQKTLEKRGLDEKSKAHFVSILWRFAESDDPDDEKRTLAAWRILGRGFIGEKLAVDKPQELPLGGGTRLKEGLERMGFGDDVIAKLSPVNLPASVDLDEDESDGLGFDA